MLWPAYFKRYDSVWFVQQTCQLVVELLAPHCLTMLLSDHALQIRAICDYGITESEMKRYMDAMLKEMRR